MMDNEARIEKLGIELPKVVSPKGAYVPAVHHAGICWSAGQIPVKGQDIAYIGRVGRELTLEEGRAAAELAVLNALAAIRFELDSLDAISRIIRLGGYVNSDSAFEEQHKVMNGASEMLHRIFGEAGRHARSSLGTSVLPFNSAVEVELVVGVAG